MKSVEYIYDHPGKILIVDDEIIRTMLTRYLSNKEYIVDTADNGQTAMDKLTNDSYELVLTDLKMPQMGGRELLQHMSKQYPTIPKIVLTGYGTDKEE